MLLYAIGDKIAIDASQISLFELMLIASRHKEDSVLLVESNDKNSIYACKDDLVIRYEFKKVLGRISTEGFFDTLVSLCQYEEFNQFTDIEDEDGMTIAVIKFKGIAQKFKVQLDDDFHNADFQKQNYQAQDIEKYFGEWELV